jgi:hypothetical protein
MAMTRLLLLALTLALAGCGDGRVYRYERAAQCFDSVPASDGYCPHRAHRLVVEDRVAVCRCGGSR